MKRFIAVADTHGQLRKRDALVQVREFACYFRPHLLIHLGDNWDLRALRRGASEEDRSCRLRPDFNAAEDSLDVFFGAYAPAKKVYLQGNHDSVRIERLLDSPQAERAEFAQMALDEMNATIGRFADENITWDKRDGIYEFEGMRFLHGYNCGIHCARKLAIAYRTSMMGHVHAFSRHDLEDLDGSVGYTVACMCDTNQEYNRGQVGTLRQKVGFAYGFLDGARNFHEVHFAEWHPDHGFHLPTEWNAV